MSADGDVVEAPAAAAPVIGEENPTAPEPMDLMTAVRDVLKNALCVDGLARGIHECAKALDKRNAHLCLLSSNCSEAAYTKLVKALCEEHQIHLIMVPDGKTLGEWAGLCKIDKEGNARKVVGASCVVVKDYGPESPALTFLMEHLKNN